MASNGRLHLSPMQSIPLPNLFITRAILMCFPKQTNIWSPIGSQAYIMQNHRTTFSPASTANTFSSPATDWLIGLLIYYNISNFGRIAEFGQSVTYLNSGPQCRDCAPTSYVQFANLPVRSDGW